MVYIHINKNYKSCHLIFDFTTFKITLATMPLHVIMTAEDIIVVIYEDALSGFFLKTYSLPVYVTSPE